MVLESKERRLLFLDDLEILKKAVQKDTLSRQETRDCSGIIFRWLFDKHPLLQDLCNELGIQLTFPGESQHSRKYHEIMESCNPTIMLPLAMGKRSLFKYRWIPLPEFSGDTAFIVNGHSVSVEALVKFVRNKLGDGHFDPVERKRWQKDIVAMTNYTENDNNFMNHHMKEIVIVLLESVYENRIEVHAKA